MKSFYLLILVVLSSLVSHSQNSFTDLIYPIHGNDSIANCHILKIRKWNIIVYEKNDYQDTVKAIAVIKKGRFIDFRSREEIKNNAYPILNSPPIIEELPIGEEYYQFKYRKSITQKKTALIVACLGVGCSLTALYSSAKGGDFLPYTVNSSLFIAGGVLFNFGVPMWISNSIKAKRNKEAMLRYQEKNVSVNVGFTNNGAGLVIKF